ncbi:hypothetical protein EAXG_05146 [Escherichia coli TA054]|nr:hypothetical protein EAXG_05146 [Escherichia coli TA054]
MAHKPLNLGAAIMQPGRQASAAGNVVALGETPMILTLDQLRPNPDNPRTTRNPRYDDIKNSNSRPRAGYSAQSHLYSGQ